MKPVANLGLNFIARLGCDAGPLGDFVMPPLKIVLRIADLDLGPSPADIPEIALVSIAG